MLGKRGKKKKGLGNCNLHRVQLLGATSLGPSKQSSPEISLGFGENVIKHNQYNKKQES